MEFRRQHICQPRQSTHTIHTVRNHNDQSTIPRTSKFRGCECTGTVRNADSNTLELSIDNRTRSTQLGAPRTAAARPRRNTAPKHHHFNMGTATRTDQARISKFRPCDHTRTVWNAISNATEWSIDNATRKKFGMRNISRLMQRKTTRPEGAHYITVAASAPQAPGSQQERHRVNQHTQQYACYL